MELFYYEKSNVLGDNALKYKYEQIIDICRYGDRYNATTIGINIQK